MAGPRMLQDRGARYAMVAMAVIMLVAVLNHQGATNAWLASSVAPQLEVRVYCDERTANGARATLRPPLSVAAAAAGRVLGQDTSGKSGQLVVRIPTPTPPGWTADLWLAAPGCLTVRSAVQLPPEGGSVTLPSLTSTAPPVDLRDPPVVDSFPPKASPEKLEVLRGDGVFATQRYYLFDGPTPACSQCHAQSALEHARGHGKAPSARVLEMAALAPEGERPLCVRCHAPVVAVATREGTGSIPVQGGFSCQVCHRVDLRTLSAGQGMGPATRFLVADDRRSLALGTRPDTSSPVMAVAMAPGLHGEDLCAACHAQARVTSRGLLVVDPTVAEHAAWKLLPGNQERTCQTCHGAPTSDVALVDGAARAMWGVDRPEAPRRSHRTVAGFASSVKAELAQHGDVLELTLTNVGASHALPGVAPGVGWRVSVSSESRVVSGPLLADGRAGVVLRRVFTDGKGDTCVAPWNATALDVDNRLQPRQPVMWTWHLADASPARASVRVERVEACSGQILEVLSPTEEAPRGPPGTTPSPE